ncbi:MAG: hypothetical protein ABIG44_15855 [Planctomycetota bacterium]
MNAVAEDRAKPASTDNLFTGKRPPHRKQVWLAPWLGIVNPPWAGSIMSNAKRRDFVGMAVAYLILLTIIVLGLEMWNATLIVERSPIPSPTSAFIEIGESYYSRDLMKVWHDWHWDTWWGPAEWILTLTPAAAVAVVSLLAFLYLPRVHRIGSLWQSYRRTWRTMIAGAGLVIFLLVFIRGIMILREHGFLPEIMRPEDEEVLEFTAIIVIPIVLWLIVGFISRAVSGAEQDDVELELPPRCEGCGYDLTHVPGGGLCTECGLATRDSLVSGRRRSSSHWSRERSWRAWWNSSKDALLAPRRFYQSLELRSPGSTERGFAGRHYMCLAGGAFMFLLLVLAYGILWDYFVRGQPVMNRLRAEPLVAAVGISLCYALGCWFAHRMVGAVIFLWWMSRDMLPDGRWAAKVITYEVVYIWVLSIAWGAVMLSFFLFKDWIGRALGMKYVTIFLMPTGFVALILGSVVLVLLWLLRWRIIYRAIRWSNY